MYTSSRRVRDAYIIYAILNKIARINGGRSGLNTPFVYLCIYAASKGKQVKLVSTMKCKLYQLEMTKSSIT